MESLVAAVVVALLSLQPQPPAALRIVVLEGEGAVNIIQQKTAVRPLVEVRDRNNVPVVGASVTFTIGGGQPAAFAGGVQTLTVTTNAAGQAAASGLNAISSGAFQIQVQAAYQGQIATAAISQTNFATAAAAAQAGSASSGAAGGAAGGGGGISGTTIGIVGAAVAGGAVAATQIGGDENRDDGVDGNGVVNDGGGPNGAPFNGSFSGQLVFTNVTTSPNLVTTCVSTRNVTGTLRIQLATGIATGTIELRGTESEVSFTASNFCSPMAAPINLNINGAMSGPPTALAFTSEIASTNTTSGGSTTATVTWRFTGSVSGNTITGTLAYQVETRGTNVFNGVSSTITGSGSTSYQVTLTR